MPWWWIAAGVIYYIGAVITLRQTVLWFRGMYGTNWTHEHNRGDVPYAFGVAVAVAFWPLLAFALGSWRLAFPAGQTWRRYFVRRRQDRQERAKRGYEAALKFLETIAEDRRTIDAAIVDRIVYPSGPRGWVLEPVAEPAAARAAEPDPSILARDLAEAEFTRWQQQVWDDRGKPWAIGALQKVRIRHNRAKEAANA
jgi:hypothetical protein